MITYEIRFSAKVWNNDLNNEGSESYREFVNETEGKVSSVLFSCQVSDDFAGFGLLKYVCKGR